MVASSVLLIADDEFTRNDVTRLLARLGHLVMASASAAEAVQLFGEHLPALVLLDPTVESGRGEIAVKALKAHPEAGLLRLVLLGESIPGYALPVEPLPIDLAHFEVTLAENLRLAETDEWSSVEPKLDTDMDAGGPRVLPPPPTVPSSRAGDRQPAGLTGPRGPLPSPPDPSRALEKVLFGDLPSLVTSLHQEVEAQAMARIDSSLLRAKQDHADEHRRTTDPDLSQRQASEPTDPGTEDTKRVALSIASPGQRSPSPQTLDALQTAQAAIDRAKHEAIESKSAQAQADSAQAQLERRLDDMRLHLEHAMLERDAAREALAKFEVSEAGRAQRTFELEQLKQATVSQSEGMSVAAQDEVLRLEEKLDTVNILLERQINETVQERKNSVALHAELDTLKKRLLDGTSAAELAQSERAALEAAHQRQAEEASARQQAFEALMAAHQRLEHTHTQTIEQLTSALAGTTRLEQQLEQTTNERDQSRKETDDLKRARLELAQQFETEQQLAGALRQQASFAETQAREALAQVEQLKHSTVMRFGQPAQSQLSVERTGEVDTQQLAKLVRELVLAQASVILELNHHGQLRSLSLRDGLLGGAQTSLESETLFEGARRDGLIDANQLAALNRLGIDNATTQIELMVERRLLRQSEVEALTRRQVEFIALQALAQSNSSYQLLPPDPKRALISLQPPTPLLPLLTEAIRRSLTVEALVSELGGAQSVVSAVPLPTNLKRMGFADKEIALLQAADGNLSIDELCQATRTKPEHGWRTLLVAKWLGLVTLSSPAQRNDSAPVDLDLSRLDAKFDEVQDADYFTILGLPRHATSDDVRRSFERLSQEFHPLKYVGVSDGHVQHRAQVVSALIEEAARSLEDDGRRTEYARHLTD